MESKSLELAKKLFALHKQGIGGEKTNATEKLQQLMEKHGITWDMLEENHRTAHQFEFKKERFRFFIQIVANVCGNNVEHSEFRYAKKGHRRFEFIITPSEFVEITAKFEFYWTKYQEDLELFYNAFIQKNKLYTKQDNSKEDDSEPLSLEERQRLWKIANMMNGLDRHTLRKQIEG